MNGFYALKGSKIQKARVFKKLGKVNEARALFHEILTKSSLYNQACAFAGLNEKKNMLKTLEMAIKEREEYRIEARFDPDFEEYQGDPDFQKLVYRGRKNQTLFL